ncbi:hypothetical protein E4T56_gene19107 [Termitomyces sp. T112]|nr:hypothetical protein E4T56_gene19107 [Termitomyces sp. T112]
MKFYDRASSDDESESEQSSGDDYIEESLKHGIKRKRGNTGVVARKSPRKPKAPLRSSYIANIIEMATTMADMSGDASTVDRIDSSVLEKIKKAMRLATHPRTSEVEAKIAMRMATKFMASQNITQADLIANESAEERSTRAGNSRVRITSTTGKMVRNQRWYDIACEAVCEAFDVHAYSEKDDEDNSLDWVYYGIADNTVAAALAFEMLHNQIELWAIETRHELKGRSAGISYRIGVSERVLKDAERAKRKALKQAKENEQKKQREEAAAAEAARASEIARLDMPSVNKGSDLKVEVKVEEDAPGYEFPAPKIPTPSSDEDDDSNSDYGGQFETDLYWDEPDGGLHADFEGDSDAPDDLDLDALEKIIKIKAEMGDLCSSHTSATLPKVNMELGENIGPVKVKSEPAGDVPNWSSALQLRTFRDNAQTIAENYLKDSGLKLCQEQKRAAIKLNTSAYSKGWDDGKKVDLKRRRIEGLVHQST